MRATAPTILDAHFPDRAVLAVPGEARLDDALQAEQQGVRRGGEPQDRGVGTVGAVGDHPSYPPLVAVGHRLRHGGRIELAAHLAAGDPTIWRSRRRAAASLRNGNFRRNVFDAAAARAGIEGVTPYGLRHTAASLAIASGATVVLVCRMLGHSSPSVT
jgi:hypothetical protein